MQDNVVQSFESESVQDPTDFPPSSVAPGLRDLDQSLRCPICHELYTAPVTITCGHCFCSLCIRNFLLTKPECPICRQTASEVHIRKNPEMENAVKAWSLGRDFVLDILKRLEDHASPGSQGGPSDMGSLYDRPPKRQRMDEGDVVLVERKVTPGESTANGVRSPKPKNVKRNYKSHSPVPIPSPSPDAVECPICNKMVVERMINQHIDSGCLSYLSEASSSGARGEQKMQWSKLFGNTESTRKGKDKGKAKAKDSDIDDLSNADPLPKLSYDVLKDKRIQDYLIEHDLPTTGSRDACIARHQKWVMLFNANLDRSANRQNLSQLREELETWEAAQRKPKTRNVTDAIAHQKQHKDEFERLKEEARRRAPVRHNSIATTPGDIVVIDDEE